MNYKLIEPAVFESLPEGERIHARRISFDHRSDMKTYIFKDNSAKYSCLLGTDETLRQLPKINGLRIVYDNFGEEGFKKTSFILIECSIPAYFKNYTEILTEILTDFDSGKEDITVSVQKVISKWRHFLSEPKSEILPEDKIIGLLGEVIFLRKLIPEYAQNSVGMWTGDRGEEDFIRNEKVVEVKTTLKERHEHIINGIDQLRVLPGRLKHICSFLFVKSSNDNSVNLPDTIDEIAAFLHDFPEAYELFFRKLKHQGYDTRDIELYRGFSYLPLKAGIFLVDDNFPKLTTAELSQSLNPRISKVRYLLDMEGLPNLSLSEVDIKDIL